MSSSIETEDLATPSHRGYRMPAEWESHQGTWLSWPHNPDTWPNSLADVERFYLELIRAIAVDETVYLNVVDDQMERMVRQRLHHVGIHGQVQFLPIPTNDAWCRDYGPTVLTRAISGGPLPERIGVNWEYNAWGGKYPPFDADNGAAVRMAAAVEIPCVAGGITLEGGAIDTNGNELLMTTASCLLNPNRNPGITKELVEHRLRTMLGVSGILWLGGELVGDDTDGHIDNLARFVDSYTVVCVAPDAAHDRQATGLAANLEQLKQWRGTNGVQLQVRPLPLPEPVTVDGALLPASYANFYLTNHSVLVPQYQCRQDAEVCEILGECFPDRRVVPIDCTYAIRGLGAIHCLTQQLPAARTATHDKGPGEADKRTVG